MLRNRTYSVVLSLHYLISTNFMSHRWMFIDSTYEIKQVVFVFLNLGYFVSFVKLQLPPPMLQICS